MMKEIKIEDTKGKTIAGYDFSITSSQMVITFSDNTFTTLGVLIDIYDGMNEIIPESIELFDFGNDKLIKLGIISPEKLKIKKQERDLLFKKKTEDNEKELLKRLKIKYANH